MSLNIKKIRDKKCRHFKFLLRLINNITNPKIPSLKMNRHFQTGQIHYSFKIIKMDFFYF